MITFTLEHPRMTHDALGYLPMFLSELDPRSAVEQLHGNYAHGGGWMPFKGFELLPDNSIQYPGDPPLPLLAQARLRDEVIRFYPGAWVMVFRSADDWEIARMD